jgi:APA family basic amino acid/polyamine antiporter
MVCARTRYLSGAIEMADPEGPGVAESATPSLQRELGLFEVVVYGVGLILGAGIYAILGEAAGVAGEALPMAFLLAAAIATLTGLSYAELSSRFPKGEGDYVYVREGLDNKRLAEAVALLRVFVGSVSAAAVALAFGGYLATFVPVAAVPAAIGLIGVASLVNFWGIDVSAKVNLVFTAAEVAGLAIVIWVGRGTWAAVDVLNAPTGLTDIVGAAFLVFFAYLGFGSIVNVAEETENPTRTVPRAIIVALGLTTLLYVAVALSAVGLVDWQVLGASGSPLALVARAGGGDLTAAIVAAIALTSTANTVLIMLVSTSRLVYGVSKTEYRSFPSRFARIHPERQTPYLAVGLVGVVTIPVVLLEDLGQVASVANGGLLVVFVVVNGALLKLRYDKPEETGGFTAPLTVGRLSITALGGVLTSLGLLLVYLTRVL